MKTPGRWLALVLPPLAWMGGAPEAVADPPTCMIEVGVTEDNQLVWKNNEDPDFVSRDGFLRVHADVADWVYVLADAWVQPPAEPWPQSYIALIANFPFLEKADSTTLDPLEYGALPQLAVADHLFDDAEQDIFQLGPLGVPLETNVRKYFQPVMGSSSGAAVRNIYGDPVTWIQDGSNDRLDLWKHRAVRRELTEDPLAANDINHFSFEAFWQSALIEKDASALAFFSDKDEYDTALAYGLQLTLQAVVLRSAANDPGDYPAPADPVAAEAAEEAVPGLEEIDAGAVTIGLSDPITFGVRVQGGSGQPTIDMDDIPILHAGEKSTLWTTFTPHKNSYVVLVLDSGTYPCALKFIDVHLAEFVVPAGTSGMGHISTIANTASFTSFGPLDYPVYVDPFGS